MTTLFFQIEKGRVVVENKYILKDVLLKLSG